MSINASLNLLQIWQCSLHSEAARACSLQKIRATTLDKLWIIFGNFWRISDKKKQSQFHFQFRAFKKLAVKKRHSFKFKQWNNTLYTILIRTIRENLWKCKQNKNSKEINRRKLQWRLIFYNYKLLKCLVNVKKC